MVYSYTAVGTGRKKYRGTLSANDKSEALAHLLQNDLTVLELRDAESGSEPKSIWETDLNKRDIHKVSISRKKLLSLLNQMAIMMKAGVSLSMAMDVMTGSQKDKTLLKILQEMKKDLFGGKPISECMRQFRAFPEIVVSMVATGEENGRLDIAFERCAIIVEKEIALNSKIRGAMGYPIFLLLLTGGLMAVMNLLVLPNFAGIFEQFGASLPAITVAVMGISDFLTSRWYVILAAVLLLAAGYRTAILKSPSFARNKDRLKMKLPALGEVLKHSYISRYCRVMASLVGAGVDIVAALSLSCETVGNLSMRQVLEQVAEDVKVGVSIHSSMARFPIFDPLLISMIRVGEESGMLSDSLEKMANLYEQQTEESTKRMTTMLEPALTILIALIVGTVIISIVIPMFSMYGVISGG